MLSWPGYSRTAQSHGLKQEKTCRMYFYNHQKEGKVTKPKTEKVIVKKTVKKKKNVLKSYKNSGSFFRLQIMTLFFYFLSQVTEN